MSPVIGALIGALLGLCLLLLVMGLQRKPEVPLDKARGGLVDQWKHLTRRPSGPAGRRRDLLTAASLAGGVAGYIWSGWLLALVLVPLAVFGIPHLFSNPNRAKITKLAAIEAWIRQVRSLLVGGADTTLEAALIASLPTVPAPIQPEVKRLVNRLHSRWTTDRALVAFADDLDDNVGDTVAAAMMLAYYRRGGGLVDVMDALSEAVRDEVEDRRKQESAKSGSRVAVRYMTLLVVVGIPLLMLISPTYLAPYRSVLGELVLLVDAAVYVLALVMLRRMSLIKDKPRLYPRRRPNLGGAL